MFCIKCGSALDEGADTCPQCGTAVIGAATQTTATSNKPPPYSPGSQSDMSSFQSFINFDIMITPMFMKIIYVVISALIAVAALVGLFSGQALLSIGSLVGGVIALVFFRVYCEIMIVFFKMHDNLKRIRKNTERD